MIIKFRRIIRLLVIHLRDMLLSGIYKMDIHPTARVSFGCFLDKTNPKGIHIGEESYIASGAFVLAHDYAKGISGNTYIGKRCFIGVNAIVNCGIHIGDEVIVGSGSVVTKDIPSHCIVVGNPARIIRTNIHTTRFGQLQNERI